MAKPTKYQAHHRPVRVIENKCHTTTVNEVGRCTACGYASEATTRTGYARTHLPNERGSLGFVAYYADGSTRPLAPGEAF